MNFLMKQKTLRIIYFIKLAMMGFRMIRENNKLDSKDSGNYKTCISSSKNDGLYNFHLENFHYNDSYNSGNFMDKNYMIIPDRLKVIESFARKNGMLQN